MIDHVCMYPSCGEPSHSTATEAPFVCSDIVHIPMRCDRGHVWALTWPLDLAVGEYSHKIATTTDPSYGCELKGTLPAHAQKFQPCGDPLRGLES